MLGLRPGLQHWGLFTATYILAMLTASVRRCVRSLRAGLRERERVCVICMVVGVVVLGMCVYASVEVKVVGRT